MPSLESVLASIPGYGGYLAKRQYDEQRGGAELQQASALVGLNEKMHEAAKERAFRTELDALGPEPDQTALAQLAAKYAKPGEVLKTQQSSLDRQASIEVAKGNKEAALAQAKMNAENLHEQRMARLSNDKDRAAETARHNSVMEELRRASSASPKPPPGYRGTADGNLEAIPGGPADQKLQGAFNQDTATLNTTNANMDRLATAANEVLNHPGLGGVTGIRGAIPNIPGSAAANAQAKLETLRAQVGFGVLQELRNASKTGGALGSITEKEHVLLQNALAALQNSQDKDQMQESLKKVIEYAGGAKDRLRTAFNLRHPNGTPGAAPGAAPAPGAPSPQPPAPGGVGGFQEGQTATGAGGQKIVFRGGQWVPADGR